MLTDNLESTLASMLARIDALERKATKSVKRAKSELSIIWTPDGGWQGITDADRALWREAYPACDIPRQLAAMTAWLIANPKKAMKSNWRRFIANWLSRTQDRGGDTASNRPDANAERSAKFAEQLERIRKADHAG